MKSVVLVILVMGLASISISGQTLFPCSTKPTASGCPAPTGFNPLVSVDDYYDVYLESVCINQPDSWWRNKLIHIEVTVKTGAVKQTIPAYEQRTGNGCHIGISNFPLITSVPANGNRLTLSSHVYRTDDNDGVKKILAFMTAEQKDTTLNTYAAAAIPYLTAIGDIATKVYGTFAPHSTNYLDFRDTDFVPSSGVANRFDLKDEFVVFYSGSDNPKDSDIYLDTTLNLRWVSNETILAGGSTWMVFRIQKRQHRTDYPQRAWYMDWAQLVREVKTRSVDESAVKKRIASNNILLNADKDYTNGDKDYYSAIFVKTQDAMIAYLKNTNESIADYEAAIQTATTVPGITGTRTPNGTLRAAASEKALLGETQNFLPVIERTSSSNTNPSSLTPVIVPERFLKKLEELNSKHP